MKVSIYPKQILFVLFAAVLILLFGHISGGLLVHYFPDIAKFKSLARWTNFNREVNLPSLFSTAILFAASILLFIIGISSKKSNQPYVGWFGLSFVFCFLSIDEAISIHETFNYFGRKHLGVEGVFYFGWIIPYGILLIVLAIIYFPFLLRLPRETAAWFVGSGFIFVLGAVGFEMLGGREANLNGEATLTYWVYFTIEELLEMIGISLFIFALLKFISLNIGKLKISVKDSEMKKENV